MGELIADKAGALYGTTNQGGVANAGTVFELAQSHGVWALTLLHQFSGGADGLSPVAGLIADRSGAFYGTTTQGGTHGAGTVFKLTHTGVGGTWVLQTIHNFTINDGSWPDGVLAIDKAGALYGTTALGGDAGDGVAYKLVPSTHPGGAWSLQILHSFHVITGDGSGPHGLLLDTKSGALYGAATFGGASENWGAVFKLSPPAHSGAPWSEQVLHSFDITDGARPLGKLSMDGSGALYGTTAYGGVNGWNSAGTAYRLLPPKSSITTWQIDTLHSFDGVHDGAQPEAGFIMSGNGSILYGTANSDGHPDQLGVVYQLQSVNGAWVETDCGRRREPAFGPNHQIRQPKAPFPDPVENFPDAPI